MAKPPAGSSLLFGALADSGQIKQRKNGSYRMVLKGVDEIDWFTDRPFRSEGLWKPQKLIRQWESFFETSEPNAQASFKVGEERELITFEMFKPKFNNKKQRLSFKIDAEIINNRESDLVTGLKGKALDEVTLFIDDATIQATNMPNCFPNCQGENLVEASLNNIDLSEGKFDGSNLVLANLSETNLSSSSLIGANLVRSNLTYADLRYADLRYADLTYANLGFADLGFADLGYAELNGADLYAASVEGTNLQGADLYGANLTGAMLAEANLQGADLTNANLTYVNLTDADLTDANLTNANLTPAMWDQTICPDGTMNSGPEPCTAEQLNLA